MTTASAWSDLSTRIISAVSLLLMAVGAALFGWIGMAVFTSAVVACMSWELARLHDPKLSAVPLIVGGFSFALTFGFGIGISILGLVPALMILLLMVVASSLSMRREHIVFAFYFIAILLTGQLVIFLFRGPLLHLLLLLILTVIATDVAGYVVGRFLGGPKFWPSVSPKKTWSGVVGGWIAAGGSGALIAAYAGNAGLLVPLAMVMSFAAQLGDIFESAIKRRAGVKDASDLIPGHGGFLDRFDGTVGAAMILFALLAFDALT